MLTTNDALDSSFRVLASIVQDLHLRGRKSMGATLKPELFRRCGLSERQLGFLKFGDLLRAAESSGFIQLRPTPGGDLEVWPAGLAIPALAPCTASIALPTVPSSPPLLKSNWIPPNSFSAVRVREDLWNAFNSFSAKWVYDVAGDQARRIPENQGTIDLGLPGTRLQIPSGRDRVLGWMRTFSGVQDADTKARLLSALSEDSAAYHFNKVLSVDLKLRKAWRRYHVQQVLAAIEAWASSNNIRPKQVAGSLNRVTRIPWSAPVAQQDLPVVPPQISVPPVPPVTSTTALAPRLAVLIDELIDGLLRLRGVLQIVDIPDPKR
ncbi:MAG: hypothetical protein WB421_18005 [Terriglobales bacterium]